MSLMIYRDRATTLTTSPIRPPRRLQRLVAPLAKTLALPSLDWTLFIYDPCMNAFTPGQIDRMKTQSLTYRGVVATSLLPTATLDTVLVPASPIPPPEIV
ncbi:hypothetical protein FS842_006574 [Serendipita sp. 407]|nr:hypothetical protein FS842_006574 [Serendipita sp. 407]